MKAITKLLIIITLLATAGRANAYQYYNGSPGCTDCHGAFTDNTTTKGSVFLGGDKHTMHRSSSYMATSCLLCHTSSGDNPQIGSSAGITGVTGYGCVGCHGRLEDGGHDGTVSRGYGAGLRQHHDRNNVPECRGCHRDANPANYTPVPENVNPFYYGKTGTKAKNPCNPVAAQATNENWTVGAPYEGLDNDGNNVYDTADSGCSSCTYTLNPTNLSVAASGASGTITVNAGTGCAWTAATTNTWITLSNPVSGTSTGSVSYIVANNPTSSGRTGTVTVATQTCRIIQAAGCSYSLNPTSRSFTSSGGTGTVTVNAGATCPWTATTNATWLSITAGSSGTSTGTVNYSVDQNFTYLSRTGLVSVAGLNHTVIEAGIPCTYGITPLTGNVDANGGSVSVSIATVSECSWQAQSGAGSSWLSPAPASGAGSNTVIITAQPNPSSLSRTGTVNVANQTLTITQPGVPCSYSVGASTASISYAGGQAPISLIAPGGCIWTNSAVGAWLSVSPQNGSGSVSVTISAMANPDNSPRSGTVVLAGQTVTVNQPAAPCTYVLSPGNASLTASGGGGTFAVNTPGGCNWSASNAVSWIQTSSTGMGAGAVSYFVDPNASSLSRTGTITVYGQNFIITQAGAACIFVLDPSNVSVSETGATSSVTVTTPAGCTWTAHSDVTWISVSSTTGTGNGSFGYSVAQNFGLNARTGTVTVVNQKLTVIQDGAACGFTLTPDTQSFAVAGGVSTFMVTTGPGCPRSATSNNDWITLLSGAVGTSSGNVNYSVAANTTTSARTGTISVGGLTFTVEQAAGNAILASGVDLNIGALKVSKKISFAHVKPIKIKLKYLNPTKAIVTSEAELVGKQGDQEVYRQTVSFTTRRSKGGTVVFPSYTPAVAGDIVWTATIVDGNPDVDSATTTTLVPAQ